jgi:hypothetical protein
MTYKAIVALQFRQTYRQWPNMQQKRVEAGRTYNCIFLADVSAILPLMQNPKHE